MSEKRVLTVKCPSCGTTLQVKTRSAEKTVACPKCQTAVTATAAATTGPEEHPFAALFDEPQPALSIADPSTPPLTIATSYHRASPKQLAIAGAIFASVALAGLLLAVLLPNGPAPNAATANNKPTNAAPTIDPAAGQEAALAGQPQGAEMTPTASAQAEAEPNTANQGGNYFETLSKAQIKQGANNPANQGGFNWPGGGNQSLSPRDQQRNWDLANGGRLGAMGLKKVTVPRR